MREIPAFLSELMNGTGRIPVAIFVGGPGARMAALDHQRACIKSGLACYFSSRSETLNAHGEHQHLPFSGAYERVRALLLSPKVQALVIWTDSDEFAVKGSPVEFISHIQLMDRHLVRYRHSTNNQPLGEAIEPLTSKRVDRVLSVIQERLVKRGQPAAPMPSNL